MKKQYPTDHMPKKIKTVSCLPQASWCSPARLRQLVNGMASQPSWLGNPETCSNSTITSCLKILLLTLSFLLPIGCSCFPDHSKKIKKERERDQKIAELQKEMYKHTKSLRDGLEDLQQKCLDLDKTKLFQGDEVRQLVENKYVSYFRTQKKLQEYLARHEKDPSEKAKHSNLAHYASWYLQKIPIWIKQVNTEEMYVLILSHIKQIQEEALQEALSKLKQKFPDIDTKKPSQGDDIKELLEKRYIPYLHAVRAHGIYIKHGKDEKRDKLQEEVKQAKELLQKVTDSLQDNNTEKMHELIQEPMKKVSSENL
jgi:hypothetical protein